MYAGHHADGSSIQQHSVGATYPYIVAAFNDRAEVHAPSGDPVARIPFQQPVDRVARLAAYQVAIGTAADLAKAYHAARAHR